MHADSWERLRGTIRAEQAEKTQMADKPILATLTGDYFQPVRLHYQVFDHDGLLRAFKKLRCVEHDPTQERWVWLYDHEAKSLRFERSFAEIPKNLHPIVIGSFFLRTKDKLLLDLRSCERAILAIPFFAKHLPQRVAKVTESEIVNKLFSATENAQLKSGPALRWSGQQPPRPRGQDAKNTRPDKPRSRSSR